MMTGATGLLGSAFLNKLTEINCSVLNVTRTFGTNRSLSELSTIREIGYDIFSEDYKFLSELPTPDCIVHFAWGGLPNFQSPYHLATEFPKQKSFLEYWIKRGVKRIIVLGNCFEYGLVEGEISEDTVCKPITVYGQAKNSLHAGLRAFISNGHYKSQLIWLRVFYVKSEHRGIFGALSMAIQEGHVKFPMSNGQQIRDYLAPEEIAEKIEIVMSAQNPDSIYNICSGQPRRLIDLVEEFRRGKASEIEFELGAFDYLDYEPLEFWGSVHNFNALLSKT